MKRTQGDGINLYESYLAFTKKGQSSKSNKRITLILPLVLLLLIMLGIAGRVLLDNRHKMEELDALNRQLDTLAAGEENVQQMQLRRDDAEATYSDLATARFSFELYPVITREIFVTIRECAGAIFNISRYGFDETTGVVSVRASVASVNEVPEFVQRLRDTGLFSRVEYVGYTSEDTKEYFCEVACTIVNEEAPALEALLAAAASVSDADAAATADGANGGQQADVETPG